MISGFDFGFDGGVEASEGIVGGGVEFSLLVDVVLVEFLADDVDSEQNVDHAHLFLLWCLMLESWVRKSGEMDVDREELDWREDFLPVSGIRSVAYFCQEVNQAWSAEIGCEREREREDRLE